MTTYKDLVDATSPEYMLRQLAEECCELAQAALKLIRAENKETPCTIDEAYAMLIEELADASIMIDTVMLGVLEPAHADKARSTYVAKLERFIERVKARS